MQGLLLKTIVVFSKKSLFCIITSFDGGEACFTESIPRNIKIDRNRKLMLESYKDYESQYILLLAIRFT